MNYYIARNGQQQGPYPKESLEAWLVAGEVAADTLAWAEGMPSWQPLSQIFKLAAPAGVAPVAMANPYQASQSHVQMQPSYGGYGMVQQTAGTAVVSLVTGILGLLTLPFMILTPLFALIAIICGHMARGRIRSAPNLVGGNGLSIAGLIMGYLGMLISIGMLVAGAFFFSQMVPKIQEMQDQIKHMPTPPQPPSIPPPPVMPVPSSP